jgi:uncharacterized protein (DUF1919 family)
MSGMMNKMLGRLGQLSKRISKKIYKNYFRLHYSDLPEFRIVSNNCWAGEVYQILGRNYNTPFIGLFVPAPCFIKLISSLDDYLDRPLIFTEKSKYPVSRNDYPVALLGDVEIHFLHYKNEFDAREKWARRLDRFKKSKAPLFFKFDDRDWCRDHDLEQFHKIDLANKVSFSTHKKYDLPSNINLEESMMILHKNTLPSFDSFEWLSGACTQDCKRENWRLLNFRFPYPFEV